MPFIKPKCAACGKVAESVNEYTIGNSIVHMLKCGHLLQAAQLKSSSPEDIVSLDGRKLFHFQCEGVRFLERSGGRAGILDEMGLGKTVQSLAFLLMHPELCPFLWIGKSSLKYQYQHEIMRWMGEDAFAQVLDTGKDMLFPGCAGYIVSYDLLRRLKGEQSLVEQAKKRGVKTVILDECQQIKNSQSARTIFTRELCKEIPNVIALSGTPIKNNAAEFFPVLNILKPEIFSNESRFIMNWCDSYWNGYGYKTGGLRSPKEFHKKTQSFLIRREREEVMPDLPKIQRAFSFHEMGKIAEDAYKKEFLEFRQAFNSQGFNDSYSQFEEASNILAYLSRMRHIVGLSKIDPCIDHCMEFLGSTERKLTIFIHHKDVGEILSSKLNSVLRELGLSEVLTLTADLDAQQRFDTVEKFRTDPRARILIASTLASGEGLNLQFCSDCILLERQWNPANEEQAEGRFPRPGTTASSISATYFVAVGTVDEFFSEIVERKREIFQQTLSKNGDAISWDQSSIMKELAEVLAATGGKKWSI